MTTALAVTALKILMIGNSFSISNCSHMPQMTENLGLKLELGSLYIGGCSLQRHWENVVASTNAAFNPYEYRLYREGKRVKAPAEWNIPAALKSEKWDIVTVQQRSSLSWKVESYTPYGDNLVAKIRELAPQAEIVVQETWSYTPWGMEGTKIDQATMYARLHEAYATFARKHGLRIIPTGTAIQDWRRDLPVKYTENSLGGDLVGGRKLKPEDMFVQKDGKWIPNPGEGDKNPAWSRKNRCDLTHLNERGEYFQSLVWTATLFGADITKCTYRPDFLDADEMAVMQRIANKTVMCSRESR